MSGADDEFVVKVTYKGRQVIIDGSVFEDWTDDDPTRLRISFYIQNPGGYDAVEMPEDCPRCLDGKIMFSDSGDAYCAAGDCDWSFQTLRRDLGCPGARSTG